MVGGETLQIPYRIYFNPRDRDGLQGLPAIERAITSCLFTRHHDGYVREACLREVVALHSPWVAPFVVKLVGEYVLEIAEVVQANLGLLDRGVYRDFVASNRAFVEVTKQRAISYWNCYYRQRYPKRVGCPSFEVIDYITCL